MKVLLAALLLLAPPPLAHDAEPAELVRAREVVAELDALRERMSAAGAYAYARALVDLPHAPAEVARVDAKAYLAALAPGADLSRLDRLAPEAYDALGDLLAPHAAAEAALARGATLEELEALRARTILAADRVHALAGALKLADAPIDVCGALYLYMGDEPQTIACDHAVTIAGHGDDAYLADAGGAGIGEAALALDLGGNDTRILSAAAHTGLLGGAMSGFGALVDLAGDDTNVARLGSAVLFSGGVNGGAFQVVPFPPGVGLALDYEGTDVFDGVVAQGGVNGGAGRGGSGAMLDLGGASDSFRGLTVGLTSGVNGGANDGLGLFFDCGGGANLYSGRTGERAGVNGGGEQSVTAFVSCGGHGSRYEGVAQGGGVNGGGSGEASHAFVHLEGDAVFDGLARYGGVNGGGSRAATLFVSGRGSQQYLGELTVGLGGINGGAVSGAAVFVDLEGDDVYVARSPGTVGANGGGVAGGVGVLIDAAGDDAYDAAIGGGPHPELTVGPLVVAGHSENGRGGFGGCALLVDMDGTDRYRDAAGAPWRVDDTRVEPGACGARLDSPYV